MSHIFSVRELSGAVRDVLEGEFPFVWVRGQVSNLSRPGSGHVYFTLKDEGAVLPVVLFRGRQLADGEVHPLTGEVCEGSCHVENLADGQQVLCAGRVTAYGPRGSYQLVAELVQDEGLGRLHLAFEALKRELASQGFFDEARKMRLPWNPRRVALVTAPGGAAIQDFLRIAGCRGCGISIRLHPVLVQGADAPAQVAAAIREASDQGWAEVIVVIRGGGSIEDLWAFNTREVAQAIFDAQLPVLSGVGHEVDTTISDLVADVRAATPSHAAQLLWAERRELTQAVDELDMRLAAAMETLFKGCATELQRLEQGLTWLSPMQRLARGQEGLEMAVSRLLRAGSRLTTGRNAELQDLSARLARRLGPQVWRSRSVETASLERRLATAVQRVLADRQAALAALAAPLAALNPEAPLARGYSLVRVRATGRFLRSPRDVAAGDIVDIQTAQGTVAATVEEGE